MRKWLLLPTAVAIAALMVPAAAQAQAERQQVAAKQQKRAAPSAQSNGHVYLLRGLLNIFSLGMDDLAAKIQAKGISASVHNHSEWQGIADAIAVRYKAKQHGPVVLIGHSLGADAVMFMAEYLGKKGVPVALVVPFDGTGSFAASSNVAQVMNLTQRDYAHMRKGQGFRGQLNNIDVSGQGYGHIDIDKSARLHAMVITRVQSVIAGRRAPRIADDGSTPAPRVRPAAAAAPAAAAPASASASVEVSPAIPAATEKPASAPAATPAATSAAATNSAPATSGTTANVTSAPAPARAAAPAPAVSKPTTVPAESANRAPASAEPGAKPALRF